ncbi:hypothetical protein BJX68DRAFT_265383 [Aspergillus pseudodeflectus]|uniref:Transfer RNA methyltransferase 82 n=1 Tax=Aspergillus pseudodeflectus TaxID=176178 RepID=A0ABR4KLK3_9EURO
MAQNFEHPFQGLQFVQRVSGGPRDVLVASSGAKLYTFSVDSGQRLSVWPQDGADTSTANETGSNPENEGPPEKKRKVDPEEKKVTAAPEKKKPAAWSHIPILTSTPDGEYVVALTAEDKCIRVFQIEAEGTFLELSSRPMPKRPCSITFMDNNEILLGDKFGDVYSMPLIPSAEPRVSKAAREHQKRIAATNLTVHTQRNLKSLEMQKQQAAKKAAAKADKAPEDGPSFQHQLLLGHVSLLTDVAFVSLPSPDPSSNRKRGYILSADRDEHIRVSRGPPQAHVIENYCLGHSSFISSLCIPQWAPEILISGGGDPYLLVWNWTAAHVLHKVPLVEETGEGKDVAVRSIWASSFNLDSSDPTRLILVALEGSPTLLSFTLSSDSKLITQKPLTTTGNVLDVQPHPLDNTLLVSVDSIREPGSTQDWRSAPASSQTLLEAFTLKQGGQMLEWESAPSAFTDSINAAGTSIVSAGADKKAQTVLNTSLYGLENLRKKTYGDDDVGSVL